MSDKHWFNKTPCNFYTDGQEDIIWNGIDEMATDTIIKQSIVY